MTTINTTEKQNKYLAFANQIIWSRWFFWFATSIMSFLAVLQLVLFISNVTVINGHKFKDITDGLVSGGTSAVIWLRLLLSGIGGVTATLGLLLINRGDKKFYYFSITTAILLAANGFLSQLFFEGCKWVVVGIILATNAIIWNLPNVEIKTKRMKIWISIVITASIIFVMALIGNFFVKDIPEESPFYNSMPILDPTQFGLTVTGNILMIFKIVESRIIYGVGNIFTIVMFGWKTMQGDLVSLNQVVQGALYLVVTISGFIILYDDYLNNKGE